ncbi:hypothetical protein CBR_g24369 [Chara braunii]|uniref:Myb-like domain-containing protein n=1 Tax=Chara braunii TaxID=69332 RepID=A0A388JMM5_CHABU|nr:hypothetical protein CBR_g24369 [Chara braunii]|eukprot:GBG59021.1 hypothetical protein CBR_g24369 [Chara braunii]
MADVLRRLPLLVLVVVVFLFVVFLHVCLSCRPWNTRRNRGASTRRPRTDRPMANMQAGAPQVAGGSASKEGGEFTSLLEAGLDHDDDGEVDLRFGLSSGSAREASRTFIIEDQPSPRSLQRPRGEHTEQSTLRGGASLTARAGPSSTTRQSGASTSSVDPLRKTFPARSGVSAAAARISGVAAAPARNSVGRSNTPNPAPTPGDELRGDPACRPVVRSQPTVENITKGVSNMRAHNDGVDENGGAGEDVDDGYREDVEAVDDDGDAPIRPLGKVGGRGRGRGRGGGRGRSARRGSRVADVDDGGKSAAYWSTDDQLLLVRCKREQDMHLVGLGHNYGRMRTKEWKWEDIAKRMANVGCPREADDCMKKWDNLFQNYKKIQRFQNASGEADFFRLSNEERRDHNFKFRMERALYNEIHGGMLGNHTIFHPNIADTGNPDDVQLPRRGAGGGESVGSEAVGDGWPEERSSPREFDSNVGSGARSMKRKNTRQQALESISTAMIFIHCWGRHTTRTKRSRQDAISVSGAHLDVDGWGRPNDGEGENETGYPAMEEVARMEHDQVTPVTTPQGRHREDAGTGTSAATPRVEKALGERGSGGAATPCVQQAVGDRGSAGVVGDAAMLGDQAQVCGAAAVVGEAAGTPRETGGGGRKAEEAARTLEIPRAKKRKAAEDDEPLVNRVRKGGVVKELANRAKLWVDDKLFWTSGKGRRLYNIVNDAREYLVAIAKGVPLPKGPRRVALPRSNVTVTRLTDSAQLQGATNRASKCQNVVMRVLHGWVFKSGSRERGYTLAFQYTNRWPRTSRAYIEDRPRDDDMAAYQEATVKRLIAAFSVAVEIGNAMDGGCISHDRLSRVAESFKVLLTVAMWIMRLAGDDPRSHYEAFYFCNLVAKPVMVASMHRIFDHRRHTLAAANAATERLGKAQLTLGHAPNFIPDWAKCGVKFGHDASLSGPDEARGLEWLGTGPPTCEDDDDDDDDAEDS